MIASRGRSSLTTSRSCHGDVPQEVWGQPHHSAGRLSHREAPQTPSHQGQQGLLAAGVSFCPDTRRLVLRRLFLHCPPESVQFLQFGKGWKGRRGRIALGQIKIQTNKKKTLLGWKKKMDKDRKSCFGEPVSLFLIY